jgi:hypothetical protein
MPTHLERLKRLYRKLSIRYGTEDVHVVEILREIEALEALQIKQSKVGWSGQWLATLHQSSVPAEA